MLFWRNSRLLRKKKINAKRRWKAARSKRSAMAGIERFPRKDGLVLKRTLWNFSVLGMAFSAATAQAADKKLESKEFPAAELRKVDAANRSGALRIAASDAPQASVKVTKTLWAPTCVLETKRVGDRLIVRVQQSGFVDSDDCRADIEILTPKSVDLEIAEGSGPVDIKGIEGALSFKIGSGNLNGEGRFSKLAGQSGSGHVNLTGVAGGGKLDSGSGNFQLKFASVPLKGELEINIASGDAELLFPIGSKVQSHLTAVSGKVINELGETKNAEFNVAMKAASGNLTIKSY